VDRLGHRIESLRTAADNLRGKLAGAVGAYNAGSLFLSDPSAFETRVMELVDLLPSPISTQVVQPEYIADLMHAVVSAFGVLANLSDDFRHLQRSEIAEIGEYFAPGQVGSSTMPHKRNPWNFEHAKSMWKEFMPRMVTVYMDQISEHQRDLTNSASARFLVELILGLALTTERLTNVIKKLRVDEDSMRRNLARAGEMNIAEPLYLLLARSGHPDAHEASRKLTLAAEETGRPLLELIREDDSLQPYLAQFTPEQKAVLEHPARYLGMAAEKARRVASFWRETLEIRD
jgi:adenylosuccinate lyase